MSTARTKKRAAEAAGFTVKLALGLVFISPLIIGLFFSFQTEQELMSYPLHLLPQHFTLENYQAVFAKVPLLLYLEELRHRLCDCYICAGDLRYIGSLRICLL